MAVGIMLAVALTWFLARRKGGNYADDVIDFSLWAVIAGIVGARLSYVIPRWEIYADTPMSLFAIWQGGLAIQGGLIGGLIAGIIYTRIKKIKFWFFADLFAPGLLLGQAMGRIGCYFNGCSFGVPTDGAWGIVFPRGTDAFARFGNQPLFPTQALEFGLDIAIFALLMYFALRKKQRFDGFIFLTYAALWSVGTAMIRFLRGDLAVAVSTFTGGQVVGFGVAALALGLMFLLWKRSLVAPQIAKAPSGKSKPSGARPANKKKK